MTDDALNQAHPFDILCDIERRALAAVSGDEAVSDNAEWVGIGIRIGTENFVVDRDEVREVLMMPDTLARVPGARSWVRGLSNVRGQLLPVIDLRDFLGSGATPTTRAARVLVIRGGEFPAGLLVDEVYGFRRFVDREYASGNPTLELRCDVYLAGAFSRGEEVWPVFSMGRLLESREFSQAAA